MHTNFLSSCLNTPAAASSSMTEAHTPTKSISESSESSDSAAGGENVAGHMSGSGAAPSHPPVSLGLPQTTVDPTKQPMPPGIKLCWGELSLAGAGVAKGRPTRVQLYVHAVEVRTTSDDAYSALGEKLRKQQALFRENKALYLSTDTGPPSIYPIYAEPVPGAPYTNKRDIVEYECRAMTTIRARVRHLEALVPILLTTDTVDELSPPRYMFSRPSLIKLQKLATSRALDSADELAGVYKAKCGFLSMYRHRINGVGTQEMHSQSRGISGATMMAAQGEAASGPGGEGKKNPITITPPLHEVEEHVRIDYRYDMCMRVEMDLGVGGAETLQ